MPTADEIEDLVNDPSFEALRERLSAFNLFEALGVVRRELRHSDVLAFLLDPAEDHGLGDRFYRNLLKVVLERIPKDARPLGPGELAQETGFLDVRREWRNIDLLAVDTDRELVLLVENKIDSGEIPGQLQRYFATVERRFADHRMLPVFLTPTGAPPSDSRYHEIAYDAVHEALERTQAEADQVDPDVRTFLRHYQDILRLHIMDDDEAAELAREVYRRHEDVLDFIFQHRNIRMERLAEILQGLIEDTPGIVADEHRWGDNRVILRFLPEAWEREPLRDAASGWTGTGRILLFEVIISPPKVWFDLTIGPGDEETRETLESLADALELLSPELGRKKWIKLHRERLVPEATYNHEDPEVAEERVRRNWEQLLEDEIPAIQDLVEERILRER